MTGHESSASQPCPPTNPFSTSAVRPGALAYQFPPGDSVEKFLGRLRDHQWWGEIIGPHGSGKSTLIESLLPGLREAGREVRQFTLTSGQRRLPSDACDWSAWNDHTQVVVDGVEQLGWWQWRRLKRTCRARGCGLMITAHASFGLPTVLTSDTSLERTQQLVATLLSAAAADQLTNAEVAEAFCRHEGNVREVFFDLYDRYEPQRRG